MFCPKRQTAYARRSHRQGRVEAHRCCRCRRRRSTRNRFRRVEAAAGATHRGPQNARGLLAYAVAALIFTCFLYWITWRREPAENGRAAGSRTEAKGPADFQIDSGGSLRHIRGLGNPQLPRRAATGYD